MIPTREEAKDRLFSSLHMFSHVETEMVGRVDKIFINRAEVIKYLDKIYDSIDELKAEHEKEIKKLHEMILKQDVVETDTITELYKLKAKLAEYENRSCEGCKFWNGVIGQTSFTETEFVCKLLNKSFPKDFSCNKWQPKEQGE